MGGRIAGYPTCRSGASVCAGRALDKRGRRDHTALQRDGDSWVARPRNSQLWWVCLSFGMNKNFSGWNEVAYSSCTIPAATEGLRSRPSTIQGSDADTILGRSPVGRSFGLR